MSFRASVLRRRRRLVFDPGSGENPPVDPPENEWSVNGITTADTTYTMIHLTWTNPWGQREPLLLQRREDTAFTDPDLAAPQSYSNFIWLGQGPSVHDYKDLFRYTEAGKVFYYRITAVLNLAAVRKSGATPVFGSWLTGKATLDALPAGWLTIDATQSPYNVVADNSTNNWAGIRAAAAACDAAGGGVVQLPVGTIRAWPTDAAVTAYGGGSGQLMLPHGSSAAGEFLTGLSNVVLQGHLATDGVTPTTRLNMRLWLDRSPVEWLVQLKSGGTNPTNDGDISSIRRYGFWKLCGGGESQEECQLRRCEVDMGAVPVDTGKAWQSLHGKRYEWDTSHKVFYGFGEFRNGLIEDCVIKNGRGEMLYSGGFGFEKVKFVRVKLSQSNSSITSGSWDSEYEDVEMRDASNALIESAPHSLTNNDSGSQLVSNFTGLDFWQNTIIRRLNGRCLDQSSAGVFKNLTGLKTFSGLHVFNQKDTYQTFTDSTIAEWWDSAVAPWYEAEDGFYENVVLENPARSVCRVLDFRTNGKVDYKLSGGLENFWILNLRLNLNKRLFNGGALFYCQTGQASENDLVIEQLHVNGNGHTITRVIQDSYGATGGRVGFTFKDWTWENLGTDASYMVMDNSLPFSDTTSVGKRVLPLMVGVDFFEQVRWVTPTDARFQIRWNRTRLRSNSGDTDFYAQPVNVSLIPVGQVLDFRVSNSGDRCRFAADSSWNTWTSEQSFTGSTVRQFQVVDVSGTRKLALV